MERPRVFVGSSTERLGLAWIIQKHLGRDVEVTVWNQGLFRLSSFVIDTLEETLSAMDFAVFVFGPDDIVHIRDRKHTTARDNVVFELGLFIGRLGRRRCFVVLPEGHRDFRIPSDLTGLQFAYFDESRRDGNLEAALGSAVYDLAREIKHLGPVRALDVDVRRVQAEQARQRSEISSLRFLISHFINEYEVLHLQALVAAGPARYEVSGFFKNELRHLRSLGFITSQRPIAEMPEQGDMKDHLQITEQGKEYLRLRAEMEQEDPR